MRLADLARLGVPLRRAAPFLVTPDHRPRGLDGTALRRLVAPPRQLELLGPCLSIRLADPVDFDGWRDAARRLAAAGTAPEAVAWRVGEAGQPGLFDDVAT